MFKRSRAPKDVLAEVERREKEAKRLGLLPRMFRGGDFEVRRFAGPERWVQQLGGLRVTHLTDLHVGRVTPMDVQREAVAITNGQAADLVVQVEISQCDGHKLVWVGPPQRFLHKVARGEHYFELVALEGGRTRIFHGERFTGLAFEIPWSKLEPIVNPAYKAFNDALKKRVESMN